MFAIYVSEAQVDVGADALHRLNAQPPIEVLGVGARGGQAKAEAVHRRRPCLTVRHDVFKEAAVEARVRGRPAGRREVVLRDQVHKVVGDATAAVGDANDEVDVIRGDGHHDGRQRRRVVVGLHGGAAVNKKWTEGKQRVSV